MTRRIFTPTSSAEDWKQLLADPEMQWRMGFSARALAYCWENTDGLPPEVEKLLINSGVRAFQKLELLLALPEYKVYFPPTNGRPSQNDLYVLVKNSEGELMSIAVEGKVSETFGPTIQEWNPGGSNGKTIRFEYLKNLFGLENIPSNIRYQLLHRSASAIIEARKFNAKHAIMLVHSFSPKAMWLEEFQAFASLFDIQVKPEKLYFIKDVSDVHFYIAWVKGNPKFLEK